MAELFSSNCDIRKNAYLNWRTRQGDPAYNLHIMASNFADSALTLINAREKLVFSLKCGLSLEERIGKK